MCCYSAVATAALLLLAAADRYNRVPDGAMCRCGLLHLCFLSLDLNTIILNVQLGSTVSHVQPLFAFGMVFARRSSPCSSLPTLPEAASAVLSSFPGAGCYFPQLG